MINRSTIIDAEKFAGADDETIMALADISSKIEDELAKRIGKSRRHADIGIVIEIRFGQVCHATITPAESLKYGERSKR